MWYPRCGARCNIGAAEEEPEVHVEVSLGRPGAGHTGAIRAQRRNFEANSEQLQSRIERRSSDGPGGRNAAHRSRSRTTNRTSGIATSHNTTLRTWHRPSTQCGANGAQATPVPTGSGARPPTAPLGSGPRRRRQRRRAQRQRPRRLSCILK